MAKIKRPKARVKLNAPAIKTQAMSPYFPNKPIWLVFDQSNGHKASCRYVWWFDTKKDAIAWSKTHLKNQSGFSSDISEPVRWKPYNYNVSTKNKKNK